MVDQLSPVLIISMLTDLGYFINSDLWFIVNLLHLDTTFLKKYSNKRMVLRGILYTS